MTIGLTFDNTHGLVQSNNASGVTLTGDIIISGSLTTYGGIVSDSAKQSAVLSGTAITVTAPGFYYVTASAATVVTLPKASAFPGGRFTFVEVGTLGAQVLTLTGSSYLTDRSVFHISLFASSSAVVDGTRLATTAGGSVTMLSDSRRYLVEASSGSVTLAGTVNF
jgi:hypothetical protein